MITDLHFGIRKGNEEFLKSQMRFIKEQFIPELVNRQIKIIVFGGDLFEYRTHVNVKIANAVFDMFKNDLSDFTCYVLAGNHDIYYNNTVRVNSVRHLGLLPNVTVIEDITPLQIGDKKFLLVPWQTSDSNFIDFLSKSVDTYDVCLCHYAIHGFLLNKSKVNVEEGISSDVFFTNFKLVISGHFHSRSSQSRNGSKIVYMGSPWHLSRIDIGEEKGALVLDCDSLEYEFIDNQKSIRFVSIKYPESINRLMIEGNSVDVHIEYNKNYDDEKIHQYIQEIESYSPVFPPNVKIINDFVEVDISGNTIKSTGELIEDYISALDVENKKEIYDMIINLYNEAKGDL